MKRIIRLFSYSLVLLFLITHVLSSLFQIPRVRADELEEIEKQIAELEEARQMSIAATQPLEEELGRLDEKLELIQASLKQAEENILALEKNIAQRESDFERHYIILAERVESYYKNLRQSSKIITLFSSQTASDLTKDLAYRQMATDEDKKIISQISNELLALEKDKKQVEEDKQYLAVLQKKTDEQAAFFRQEIKGAKTYQAELSNKIAELSAKQQQLLSQRLASLNLPTSLGAGPLYCTDDRKIDPGFSPAFAFYTFGIPHRVGLNQYGAYGRAKAGQKYQEILRAYFNADLKSDWPNVGIKIQGQGERQLEDYLLGIYEVPESWPIEALKAQAVAARSYALAYTNNGAGEICTTQACQVWKSSPKSGAWKQAVESTRGQVLVSGGTPIKAWYSSTDGGYTHPSAEVWGSSTAWTKNLRDASGSVGSFAELQAEAYDKDSPCFYAAQGWRAEYSKSAWLRPEEVADIVNALLLAKKDDSTKEHLLQPDESLPYGG